MCGIVGNQHVLSVSHCMVARLNLLVRFLSCGVTDGLVGSSSHWPIHCCIIQWGMSDWVRYTVLSTECVCFSSARVQAESA